MNVNPYHSERVNQNLLDNWYFGNPVNQRGQTEYTNIGYTIDRWRTAYGDSPTITIDGGVSITECLYQPIEKYRITEGENYTISALLSDNTLVSATGVATWHDTWTAIVNVTVGSFTFRLVAGQTGGYWSADIIGAGETVIAVKVEQGDRQTLAYQKDGKWELYETANYDKELLECQRYYVHSLPHTRCYLNSPCLFAVNLPVQMRAKPTIVGEIMAFTQGNNAYVPGVTVTVNEIRNNAVILQASGISEDCYLALNIDSFDANL